MARPPFKKIAVMASVGLTMTGVITSVMTWWNLPAGDSFLGAWLKAWLVTFLVMLPMGLILFTAVDRMLKAVFPDIGTLSRGLATGFCMALLMESVMASSVTLRLHGLSADFPSIWLSNFLVSLPIGLAMGMAMSLVVKPRLDRYLASA